MKFKSYKQVEEHLLSEYPNKLNLKGYTHSDMPFKEFIKLLIGMIDTKHGYLDLYTTYHGDLFQCNTSKRRSFGDIWLICKTYYPDLSFREVREFLMSEESVNPFWFCKDIKKHVLLPFKKDSTFYGGFQYGKGPGWTLSQYITDEYGWTKDQVIPNE